MNREKYKDDIRSMQLENGSLHMSRIREIKLAREILEEEGYITKIISLKRPYGLIFNRREKNAP